MGRLSRNSASLGKLRFYFRACIAVAQQHESLTLVAIYRCRVDPSRDAGEGFNITPGKSAHVFALQRGLFEKNSKKRSSAADSGRIFKLRAQNIQERDVWIEKLRQAAGGY